VLELERELRRRNEFLRLAGRHHNAPTRASQDDAKPEIAVYVASNASTLRAEAALIKDGRNILISSTNLRLAEAPPHDSFL
jgi:hypothetical protein